MHEKSNLRILLACARPLVAEADQPISLYATRPGEEMEAVRRGLEGISREIRVTVHGAAALPEVNRELMNAEPEFDVLHFIGHGDDEMETLLFESDSGIARPVVSDELARLVEGRVRLLVAMACFSETIVGPLFEDGKPCVPAAICVNGGHPIQVRAAGLFSGALYSGLARGRTLKQSFQDAVDVVRMDDFVGELTMPDRDGEPTPWRRFVLKGDEELRFPDVPAGEARIEEIIQKSPHTKIARTGQLFVGRSMEMAATAQLLAPPIPGTSEQKARIITLCGEGGIGKTRLAQAVGDWLAERGKFPGGIFEVECDRVTDVQGLTLAILKGLGVEEAENVREPAGALVGFLKGMKGRTLLVLDNLDDLFAPEADSGEAGKLLKECLTASTSLNILVTCRWPLELGIDENAFTVEPMTQKDAAELFVMCLDRDIKAELSGDIRNIAAFGRIVKLTDGMPLCIILAARRSREHGKDMQTLLKDAAEDLVKTMEDPKLKHLPERLRSLRASLDLSYDHLSEPARELFARMSFFPGGLSRDLDDLSQLLGDGWKDAAEEVAHCALARYERTTDRYTMLHPVMEYARGKLDEVYGNYFRRRVVQFWLQFTRWHSPMIEVRPNSQKRVAQLVDLPDNPEEQRAVRESLRANSFVALTAEESNLVHAAQWSMEAKDETGLSLVDSLTHYLELRRRWYTEERLYQLVLPRLRQLAEAEPEEYVPGLAEVLGIVGKLYKNMGHPDKALKYLEEGVRIYRKLSESQPDDYMQGVAKWLIVVASSHSDMGYSDEALEYNEEALEMYRELAQSNPDAYRPDMAGIHNNMGALHWRMGHLDESLKHFAEALAVYRELAQSYPDAYSHEVAGMLNNIGGLLTNIGHFGDAETHLQEALAVYRELTQSYPDVYSYNLAMTLSNVGELHQGIGRLDESLKHYEEALEIRRELARSHPNAYRPDVAGTLNDMGHLFHNMGHLDESLKRYEESLEIYRELAQSHPDAYRPSVAGTLTRMGYLLDNMGHLDESLKCYEESLELYRELAQSHPDEYRSGMANALNRMGILHWNMGHPDESLKYNEEALEMYQELAKSNPDAYRRSVANVLNDIGAALAQIDRLEEALKRFAEALEARKKLYESHPDAYRSDLAMSYNNMGALVSSMGYPDESLKHHGEALELYQKLAQFNPDAYRHYVAMTYNNIGNLLANIGHLEESLKHYGEALEIYREFFRRYPLAHVRNLLTALRGVMGVYEKLGMEEKMKECGQEMEKVEEIVEAVKRGDAT